MTNEQCRGRRTGLKSGPAMAGPAGPRATPMHSVVVLEISYTLAKYLSTNGEVITNQKSTKVQDYRHKY